MRSIYVALALNFYLTILDLLTLFNRFFLKVGHVSIDLPSHGEITAHGNLVGSSCVGGDL